MAIVGDISRFQARVDERQGYREEALFRPCAGEQLMTFVYQPLRVPHSTATRLGIVFCHAYGVEQLTTYRLEVNWARSLASYFPVLRLHTRGSGQSSGDPACVTLATQLADTLDSARWFMEHVGVRELAFIGIRLGGTVALLAAQQMDEVRGLMMLDPITSPAQYLTQLLRNVLMAEMTQQHEQMATMESLIAAINEKGLVDVLGNPIHRPMYEEAQQLDVLAQIRRYHGPALLIQTGRTRELRPDMQALSAALTAAGANCDVLIENAVLPWLSPRLVMDNARAVFRLLDECVKWCCHKVAGMTMPIP
jgi:pimeloyl-ACP methyl ester carboxylesterase